ncbi:HpcH/HpaI aldolase family protein [Roseivivax sp. CAU 1761]
MELPRNAFKAALAAGRRQIGLWCTLPDPAILEMHAQCGYDWLLIDTEHTPIDVERALPLLQAVAAAGQPVSAAIRPGWNDLVEIKKALDIGAQTIVVPYVQSAEEAEAAVAALHYPPRGVRGVGGSTRASRYGMVADYAGRASDELCLILQVETRAALDALDDILGVEGVDGIFIGPADLSASLGHAGNPSHPEVRGAILDATRRIRAAGRAPGILTHDDSLLRGAAEAGALFLALGVDLVLLRGAVTARRAAWHD